MANDTLDPDSEIASELPGDGDIADGGTAPEGEGTTDAADQGGDKAKGGKEKALADTEAALKERQAEFTRLSQQMAEMKGQLAMFAQMSQASKQTEQREEKDWLDDIKDDDLVENPAKVKGIVANIRREFADVLQARDAYWKAEIAKVKSGALDPSIAETVAELRNDPDLSDLPDAKLIAMATRLNKAKPPKSAVRNPPGGVVPGRRGSAVTETDKESDELSRQFMRVSGVLKDKGRDDTLE